MASKIELKPCPCCGGHATMEHGAERSENGWVVCMDCGLSTRYHHDPAEAAAEWNRRCGYMANRKDDAWRWARGIIAELAAVVRAECEGEKYHVTLLADADSIVSSDPQSTVHNGDCVPQTARNALAMVKKLFDGRIMWQPDIRKAHEAVNAALAALEGGSKDE